jgi:hypothetical protein
MVDTRRGDLSRSKWINQLVEYDMRAPEDPMPEVVAQIVEDAVWKATQAYRNRRPGYGEFILTRAAMAVHNLEQISTAQLVREVATGTEAS